MRNKRIGRRYVNPSSSINSTFSLSGLDSSDQAGNVSPSRLHALTALTPNTTARATANGLHLSNISSIQNLYRAFPIDEEETQGRRKKMQCKKRRSSSSGDSDDVSVHRRLSETRDSSEKEEEEDQEEKRQEKVNEEEEMVTISVLELEKWQQRVIFHVEDHFSNEQLKRIAEFGRVHGSIVQEAKQYVSNMEIQMMNQFEEERAALRAQAEEFIAKTAAENKILRHQVDDLTQQVDRLEKVVDTLEKQVNIGRSDVAQNHQKQDMRHQEHGGQVCQTFSPSNNRAQVQHDSGETHERVGNGLSNVKHVNGYRSGSKTDFSSPQPAKQRGGELIDCFCLSIPTDSIPNHVVCLATDQERQHQQLDSSCKDDIPTKFTLLKQNGHKKIDLSKTPAGAGKARRHGDG